ncbi:MAG: TetR/AcrR family transcriptional regulator [Actinomycetota bacterium]
MGRDDTVSPSKSAMIDTAATLFRQQGYEATSWRQIVAESGAPGGSIGHHFPEGKEQLAVDVAMYVGRVTGEQIEALINSGDDPVAMMRRWIRVSARMLDESGFADGCPLATMALEVAHRLPAVQHEIAAGYNGWSAVIADRLAESHGAAAADTAELLLAAFEGALLLSRARHDTQPLELLAERVPALLAALEPNGEH